MCKLLLTDGCLLELNVKVNAKSLNTFLGHLLESSHVLMEKFFKKGAKEESSPVENKK